MAPTVTTRMPITLRSVVPVIRREPGEHSHLEKDLTVIGCMEFISKPRMVKDEKMARQVITRVPNEFDLTIRGKPETWTTWVTMTVGNTIFEALLGERKVDWGIILQAVVAKLVENARNHKAIPIGRYLFHMYAGQKMLLPGEIVAYNIGLDLVKYNCTLDPD